jgi:hypothetical protein
LPTMMTAPSGTSFTASSKVSNTLLIIRLRPLSR